MSDYTATIDVDSAGNLTLDTNSLSPVFPPAWISIVNNKTVANQIQLLGEVGTYTLTFANDCKTLTVTQPSPAWTNATISASGLVMTVKITTKVTPTTTDSDNFSVTTSTGTYDPSIALEPPT